MNYKFNKITFKQIRTFINTISKISGKDYEFIKKKYMSNAENFEEVLNFFKVLKLIKVNNKEIIPTLNFKNILINYTSNDHLVKSYLLEKILNTPNAFTDIVLKYLNNFKFSGNAFEYNPTTKKRIKESSIRNLFIELDLIRYDRKNKSYKITDINLSIFEIYAEKKILTPKELSFLIRKQEELGKAAELEILEYEKKRLANYPKLLNYLEHTSVLNVNAGYDIKSFEIEPNNNGKQKIRYIEVKAVSKFNFKFNVTRNEINKSKLYSKQYYLYLLPVIINKKFDIKALEVIQNPFEKVFKNNVNWEKQEEQYSLWKKKNNE